MSETEINIDAKELRGVIRAWRPTGQLRSIVPQHTTTEPPKLQCLWLDTISGEAQWRSIPREVVTNQEFFEA